MSPWENADMRGARHGRGWGSIAIVALFLTGLAALAACAVNPVTGQTELSLISEPEEIQMGREGAEQVARSIGLYRDPALQAYVEAIGRALAARSERPGLPWSFQVVDDPAVNAFALPGGFIFVTRGILGHLNSEAELAAVLGHEIGHVTAKHSVSQISRAQVAQLGLGLGTALIPELEPLGQLAGAGLELLFLKFGRDDENQADQLGFRYALGQGYDVHEMVSVFRTLSRVGRGGGGRLPEWLATHPNPENRLQRTEQWVAGLRPTRPLVVNRDPYLRRIAGLVFGEDPRAGYFQGSAFYHPALRFRFDFPPSWTTRNQAQAVVGVSPAKDALIQLRLAGPEPPTRIAREFFSQQGLEAGPPSTGDVNGLPAVSGSFAARTRQGTLRGLATFLAYEGATYRILAFTPEAKLRAYDAAFRQAGTSFRRLTDPGALRVQPARIEVVTAPGDLTLAQFEQRYPSSIPLAELALINGIEPQGSIRVGQTVKRVTGGTRPGS